MRLRRITSLSIAGSLTVRADPRPDADLLTLFLTARDEAAFAALVVRHTPAVRAVCRAWLGSPADLDDAAQATFLVLAQQAHSIRDPAALPKWLYRVAESVARRLARRLPLPGPLPDDLRARGETEFDDTPVVLAEEVARLPETYRRPIQLCYWAGLTAAAAGDRLGLPRNTVLTRLARGRELLRRRLVARGVAPAVLAGAVIDRSASAEWVAATVRAAREMTAGGVPAGTGIAERTVSVSREVIRAMTWNKFKAVVAAALVATAAIGFVVGQWASAEGTRSPKTAGDGDNPFVVRPAAKDPAPPAAKEPERGDAKTPTGQGRREAVIRMPVGTFVKEVDIPQYGSGRLTWTFEDDRVLGRIEASVMGVEVELATEAEVSMSRNGTLYGVVTGMRLNHLKLPQDLSGLNDDAEVVQLAVHLLPLAESLVTEVVTDLPFSYQFRLSGDRLVIQNYRALLCGPNPLGKAGGVVLGEVGYALTAFQAIGTAIEGTYAAADGKAKDGPKKYKGFQPTRPAGRTFSEVPRISDE